MGRENKDPKTMEFPVSFKNSNKAKVIGTEQIKERVVSRSWAAGWEEDTVCMDK